MAGQRKIQFIVAYGRKIGVNLSSITRSQEVVTLALMMAGLDSCSSLNLFVILSSLHIFISSSSYHLIISSAVAADPPTVTSVFRAGRREMRKGLSPWKSLSSDEDESPLSPSLHTPQTSSHVSLARVPLYDHTQTHHWSRRIRCSGLIRPIAVQPPALKSQHFS